MMMTNTLEVQKYLEAFKARPPQGPAWLTALRQKSVEDFAERGFPDSRDEMWKYTSTLAIAQTDFELTPEEAAVTFEQLQPFLYDPEDWLFVFINGKFSKNLSRYGSLSGITAGSLREHWQTETFRESAGRFQDYFPGTFQALNRAFFEDGFFLHVQAQFSIPKTVHCLFVTVSGKSNPVMAQPYNLLILEPGSRATVVESYVSLTGRGDCQNSVTNIVLKERAELAAYKIKHEHPEDFQFTRTSVFQASESRFESFSVSTGAKIARDELLVSLDGERAQCALNGLSLVSDGRHLDHYIRVDHPAASGTSRQLFKGIAGGKSKSAFTGKIYVHPGAMKTDASQTNKTILLTEDAVMDTRPQLEIYADDVKCSHGGAIGELDEKAIFYLKSRGIGEDKAKAVLCYGFAGEVVQQFKLSSLREKTEERILETIRQLLP